MVLFGQQIHHDGKQIHAFQGLGLGQEGAGVTANSSGLLSGVKKRQNYTAVGAHNLIIVLETLIYTLSMYDTA